MADVRTVKRLNDGVVKRMFAGPASRLVAKGGYEYVDGGADESTKVKRDLPKNTILARFEKKDSEVLKIDDIEIGPSELAPEQIRNLRAPKTIKSPPKNPSQKIIKKSEVPQSRMNHILAMGKMQTEAIITPGKGAGALKDIIEKAKASRKNKN